MIPVSPRQRVGMGTGKSICSAMIQYLILCYATECDRMCVRVMVSPPFPISEWVFGFLCQELKLGGGGRTEWEGCEELGCTVDRSYCTSVATGGEQLLTECAFEERDSHPR